MTLNNFSIIMENAMQRDQIFKIRRLLKIIANLKIKSYQMNLLFNQ